MYYTNMNNDKMLETFERKEGGPTKAARAIGITPQMWANWKMRALPDYGHLMVWLASQPKGRLLLDRWRAEHREAA